MKAYMLTRYMHYFNDMGYDEVHDNSRVFRTRQSAEDAKDKAESEDKLFNDTDNYSTYNIVEVEIEE